MVETYPVDVSVLDLGDELAIYLKGFQRLSLNEIHPLDKDYLQKRDNRESFQAGPLTPDRQWRNPDDYLLFDNNEGTLAYVRHDPSSPFGYHTLSFNIHFRTATPEGLNVRQYFSLAVPQRNLSLLLKMLQKRGVAISAIGDLDDAGVLRKIPEQLDEIDGEELPVRLFHSKYVSRDREKRGGYSDKGKAIEELAQAVGSIVVAADIFSRKQEAYYRASAEVDSLFGDSALIG